MRELRRLNRMLSEGYTRENDDYLDKYRHKVDDDGRFRILDGKRLARVDSSVGGGCNCS